MKVGMPLLVEFGYSHVQHINPLSTSLDQIKSIRFVGWSLVKIRFHNKQIEDDFLNKIFLFKINGQVSFNFFFSVNTIKHHMTSWNKRNLSKTYPKF